MRRSVGKQKVKKAQDEAPKKRARSLNWRTVRDVLLLTIWVFCSIIASQLVVGLIMALFISLDQLDKPVMSGIYSLASYGIALIMVLVVPPRVREKWFDSEKKKSKKDSVVRNSVAKGETLNKATKLRELEKLGLGGLPTWTDIGLSPVAYLVSTVLAIGLVYLFSLFPWFNAEQSQVTGFSPYMNSGEKAIAFLTLVVLAPIVEEVIFRGWLYGRLRARIGMAWSIIIVSVLFGLVHLQWNVGVNVFALSVVACVLREITGTIYAGILTHMIKNGVAFYLLYVIGFG